MGMAIRNIRLLQIALLASIVMYVMVGERVAGRLPPNLPLYYAISFISISLIGAIFVVRRTFLTHSEAQLRANPENPALLARWRSGYIVIYVLCESLALFGLVLRMTGFQLSQTWAFYLGSFALMLLFGPRQPKAELGSGEAEQNVHSG